MASDGNFYSVLKLRPDVDFATIRAAYRKAALSTHPDKGGSAEAFRLVSHAFEVLSNEKSRAAYDRLQGRLHAHSKATASSRDECASATKINREIRKTTKKKQTAAADNMAKSNAYSRSAREKIEGEKTDWRTQKLTRLLHRLEKYLRIIPASIRNQTLQEMPETIRCALLEFMESRSAKRHSESPHSMCTLAVASSASIMQLGSDSECCSSHSSEEDEEDCLLALEDAALENNADSVPLAESGTDELPQQNHHKPRRSPGIQQHSQSKLYRAHLMFWCIEFYTRYTTLEAAVESYIVLAQIRQAVFAQCDAEVAHEQVPQLAQHILTLNNTTAEEIGLKCSVRFSCRSFLGDSMIVSVINSIGEAMSLRRQFQLARVQGWDELRKLWVDILQKGGCELRSRKARSKAEAEQFVDEAYAKAQMSERSTRKRRPHSLDSRRDLNLQQRLLLVIRMVQHCLDRLHAERLRQESRARREALLVQAMARREAMEALKQKRLRAERRWQWLNRKDLTMDDMLGEVPADLADSEC